MEIKFINDVDLSGAILIEGLPGIGLVGPMAVSYIIDKLGMQYVGYIESSGFPPIIAIHNNRPMPPVRIYYSEKKRIATVFSEFAIPIQLTSELADKLYEMFKVKQMSSIISIGGIPMKDGGDGAFALGSTESALKDAQKSGLQPVAEGVSTGASALMLFKAAMDNVPDTNILVPVDPSIINPESAEKAIESINKLLKLNIDVGELEKESKEVQEKIQELLKKSRETQDAHKRATGEDSGPSMYG